MEIYSKKSEIKKLLSSFSIISRNMEIALEKNPSKGWKKNISLSEDIQSKCPRCVFRSYFMQSTIVNI